MMQFVSVDRHDRQKLEIFKIQDGAGRHFEKSLYLGRGSNDFDRIWYGVAFRTSFFEPSRLLKIRNFKKSKMAATAILKKRHISAAV